jgi:glycosyltransferase involved in cell wall biosynthesis
MNVLLITDQFSQNNNFKDDKTRIIKSLLEAFGNNLSIMQFGEEQNSLANWHFDYKVSILNRFEHRIANAYYIAEKIKMVEHNFTHLIFLHIAMQFGFSKFNFEKSTEVWTFPMFLSPSYEALGEVVPYEYKRLEALTLSKTHNIITPSYLEKKQILDFCNSDSTRIHVIPRGINLDFLTHSVKHFNITTDILKICSIGSIKSKKNIIELIDLFLLISKKYHKSELHIIGPTQDSNYLAEIKNKITQLNLKNKIKFPGYISPEKLSDYIKNFHIHISTSKYEIFGRAIFETLACGIPNIVVLYQNGAYEFLKQVPYVRFVNNKTEALLHLNLLLKELSVFSKLTQEIRYLYDNKELVRRIIAKICSKDTLVISDYDGTIFYKDDLERTKKFIEKFNNYPQKAIFSARPLNFLINAVQHYKISVNWIVSYSGALISDSLGNILHIEPLEPKDLKKLDKISKKFQRVILKNKVIILYISLNEVDIETIPKCFNVEIYDNIVYISSRKASKLYAAVRLLKHIDWDGNIKSYGDSKYDEEIIQYFDGYLITN